MPVDSECDQLVKQRDTECGSGGGGGEGGGSISFTVRVWGQALSQRGVKEKKWGGLQHNEHNDKQKNFSVICGRFPQTPNPIQRLDTEPLKGQGVFLFYDLCLKKEIIDFIFKMNTFKLPLNKLFS